MGGFTWSGDITTRLPEHVDRDAVFLMGAQFNDHVPGKTGSPDAPVCGPFQSDSNPKLVVSACPGVGLPLIFCEAAGYTFQGSQRLHT